MHLHWWYRLLEHTTLALACVCLLYAEVAFLPGVELLLVPVLLLLAASWWTGGRWVMPVWGANLLALLVVLGGAAWMQALLADKTSWIHVVPLPAGLVPALGPVLMALMLIKLFRPREAADFWLLQGIGLLQVALACVLALGPEFGILLIVYVGSGLGCLAAHCVAGGRGGRPWAVGAAGDRAPRRYLPAFVLRWTLLVGTLALALFLLTPRLDGPMWEPWSQFTGGTARPRPAQTGFRDGIDLNRTGDVEISDEEAFAVRVTDAAGRPRSDLGGEQRWRGGILDTYEAGVWSAKLPLPPLVMGGAAGPAQTELPDFGPGQLFLHFTAKPKQAGGLFLADPIRMGPDEATRVPALLLEPADRRQPLFVERGGTALAVRYALRQEYQYRQVLPPPGKAGRSPAGHFPAPYIDRLTRQPVVGLDEWTLRLLRRLAEDPRYHLEGALPPARPGGFLLEPEEWERTARALAEFLARGGEYTYTLDLRRSDRNLDPVLDFLLHLKQGHCERYASALTLMLRAAGIPARIVKGFRGCEHHGDGVYAVRQNAAHSWVEALVPGEGEDGFDWLTLEPTPDADAPPLPSFSLARLWEEGRRNGQQFWRTLIVDYNADDQADLVDTLKLGSGLRPLRRPALVVLGVLALAGGVIAWRRRRQRPRVSRPRPVLRAAFYTRLLSLLARHTGLQSQPGQTPREFGAAAADALRGRPALGTLADLPCRLTEVFYRVRFGGQPLDEEERQALDAQLDALAAALKGA